jgi:hypothetical protein
VFAAQTLSIWSTSAIVSPSRDLVAFTAHRVHHAYFTVTSPPILFYDQRGSSGKGPLHRTYGYGAGRYRPGK